MPRTRSDTQPILTSAELDLLKRLQSLRTLEWPVPVAAEALIQAHRYRAATASADWASLAEAAARDRDSVGMVFNRLAAAQKKVSKVASAARRSRSARRPGVRAEQGARLASGGGCSQGRPAQPGHP